MAGHIHSTGSFPELLWPGIKKVFGDSYQEWPSLYTQFFKLETSDKAFEKEQQVINLPKAVVKNEGNDVTYEQLYQGYQKEYYHYTYGLGAAITRELFEDEQYGYIKRIPKFLAKAMRELEEVLAHAILNNGTADTGPDGVSLYNAAHPLTGTGDTLRNVPATSADLTQTALEQDLINIANWTDDQGNKTLHNVKAIIVPTNYKFQVRKILETQQAVGSADNDKNIIAVMDIKPIVSPYLTDSDAYHLITDEEDGLKWFTRREAELERDNDFDTQNLKMMLTKRMSAGYTNWRGAYSSPGA